MKEEIKYIGFYDLPGSKTKRASNLAATNKMDYICDAIIEAGFDVHLVSPSWTTEDGKFKWIPQKTKELKAHKKITLCPNFVTSNKICRNLKIVFSLLWLFFWLLKHTRKGEKILMYHVQWLSLPVRWAKKLKGFLLVLEVEEIYGDVSAIHPYFYKMENDIIKSADSYLFSTDLLEKKIDSNKPFTVVYGNYSVYPQLTTPPDDDKIHILYAGIIDTHKAGAFNALNGARYLSDKYVLHIIGFGAIDLLQKEIEEVNQLNGCRVIYDGLLSGEEYVRYCQQCHIGLSTQNIEGEYLESSFPSKILSYLGMGLNVVSGKIDCVTKSAIGDIVNYYSDSSSIAVSEAIKNTVLVNSYNNIKVIQSLNESFVQQLKEEILI